jgi:hypothetical protein
VAQLYLRSRGITITPASLRFGWDVHTESHQRLPVMVGAVQHAERDGVQGVHITYLTAAGVGKANVQPAKRMRGPVGGGAVRLAHAAHSLVVAEGIETALSVQQATGVPAWAALSAVGIENLVLPSPPLAANIVIAADNDPRGLQAAETAARRFVAEGRRVRIALPPEPHADFNDALRAEAPA